MIKLNYYFEDCGGDFEFEIDDKNFEYALSRILRTYEFADFIKLIIDMDSQTAEEYFEEDLLEFFENTAHEQAKDSYEYRKDPLGYNGMSEEDFR